MFRLMSCNVWLVPYHAFRLVTSMPTPTCAFLLVQSTAAETLKSRSPHEIATSQDRQKAISRRNAFWGLLTLLGWMALREKIGPDEAEPEGCGGSTVEGENDVWPDLLHNPKGRANFPISS